MRGRPFVVVWGDEATTLFEQYRRERDPQVRPRRQALWLLRQGKALAEVAALVGVHYRTVQEWVQWYRQGGGPEVARHRVGGPRRVSAPPLTAAQEARLQEEARTAGFATVGMAVSWAQEALGVSVSEREMRRLFARLGLRKKVPRPISDRASATAQAAWKKGAWAAS
jgi:transposase